MKSNWIIIVLLMVIAALVGGGAWVLSKQNKTAPVVATAPAEPPAAPVAASAPPARVPEPQVTPYLSRRRKPWPSQRHRVHGPRGHLPSGASGLRWRRWRLRRR